jgi:hypothetical protein
MNHGKTAEQLMIDLGRFKDSFVALSASFKNDAGWDLVAHYAPRYNPNNKKYFIGVDIYHGESLINSGAKPAKFDNYDDAKNQAIDDAEKLSFDGYGVSE